MTRHLEGKVAIVTGAGGGVGRAYAHIFARHGAKVVVNDYSVSVAGERLGGKPLADMVVDEIRAAGGEAVANHADVSTQDGGASILQTALDAYGGVDILLNNAGIVRDADFADMTIEEWDSLIAVHLRGAFCVTQPVWRQLIAQGRGGVIINTTSRSALRGKTRQANYGAAKGGIIGFSNVLALEGEPHGIRVWTISPRAATRAWAAGLTTSAGKLTDEIVAHFTQESVALAALYMASEVSAPHSGRILFASVENIREVRLEAAPSHIPSPEDEVEDLLKAIGEGRLLFPQAAEREAIS
jgi:NAD(P)-dependent dehydrogenase (short-subunit alcohol dehydrogenase family)